MRLGSLIRVCLESAGLIRRSALTGLVRAEHPGMDELADGRLCVVRDGGIEKWACFRCPGGCGHKIQLSLNPNRRPRWIVRLDWLDRPTLSPSVHQTNECRCHFWVRRGHVEWCRDSGHRRQGPTEGQDLTDPRGRPTPAQARLGHS